MIRNSKDLNIGTFLNVFSSLLAMIFIVSFYQSAGRFSFLFDKVTHSSTHFSLVIEARGEQTGGHTDLINFRAGFLIVFSLSPSPAS